MASVLSNLYTNPGLGEMLYMEVVRAFTERQCSIVAVYPGPGTRLPGFSSYVTLAKFLNSHDSVSTSGDNDDDTNLEFS